MQARREKAQDSNPEPQNCGADVLTTRPGRKTLETDGTERHLHALRPPPKVVWLLSFVVLIQLASH